MFWSFECYFPPETNKKPLLCECFAGGRKIMARCTIIVVAVVAAFAVQNGQALLGFPRMGGMHGSQYGYQQQVKMTNDIYIVTNMIIPFFKHTFYSRFT